MVGPEQTPPPGAPNANPPGWAPPGATPQPPAYGQPPTYGQQPFPPQPFPPQFGTRQAVHKPGAVPLRPLGLGDVLDAAVKIIRINAGATIGASTLLGAFAIAVPSIVSVVFGLNGNLDVLLAEEDVFVSDADVVGLVFTGLSWVAGLLLLSFGASYVGAMVAHTVQAAALGRTLSLAQAWRATRGQRVRLLGLSALLGLIGLAPVAVLGILVALFATSGMFGSALIVFLLGMPVLLAAYAWYFVKVYTVATPALAVEGLGPVAAISRGSHLTRGHFWRVLGIMLLVSILVQVATSVISVPLSLLAVVPTLAGASEATGVAVMLGLQALTLVVSTSLSVPVMAAAAALLHLDLRMRHEAYDVELITRSTSA